MTREIKFRLWGMVRKKMYDWETILHDERMLSSIGLLPCETRLTWLQYTGLKDKAGHEIYEGDIVTLGSVTRVSFRGVVVQYQGCWCADTGKQHPIIAGFVTAVLGNIYENPELLDG